MLKTNNTDESKDPFWPLKESTCGYKSSVLIKLECCSLLLLFLQSLDPSHILYAPGDKSAPIGRSLEASFASVVDMQSLNFLWEQFSPWLEEQPEKMYIWFK